MEVNTNLFIFRYFLFFIIEEKYLGITRRRVQHDRYFQFFMFCYLIHELLGE